MMDIDEIKNQLETDAMRIRGEKQAISEQFNMGMGITNLEYATIQDIRRNSADPEADTNKYLAALSFSKATGTPLSYNLANIDAISEAYTGRKPEYTKSWSKGVADSITVGACVTNRGNVASKWSKLYHKQQTGTLTEEEAQKMSDYEAEIANYDSEIERLQEFMPKGIVNSILQAAGQSLPYMFEIAAEGVALGGVTALGAQGLSWIGNTIMRANAIKKGAAAVAAMDSASSVVAGKVASAVGAKALEKAAEGVKVAGKYADKALNYGMIPFASRSRAAALSVAQKAYTLSSTAGAWKAVADTSSGDMYHDMIKSGVEENVAWYASHINGFVQGGIEAALGLVPGAMRAVSGMGGIGVLTNRLVAKSYVNGKLGGFAVGLMNWVRQAGEEGVEELFQNLAEDLTKYCVQELSDSGYEVDKTLGQSITDALYAGFLGFGSALIIGLPMAYFNTLADIRYARNLQEEAKINPSKQDFVNQRMNDEAFSEIPTAEARDILGKFYDKNNKINETDINENILDAEGTETTEDKQAFDSMKGKAPRDENGRLRFGMSRRRADVEYDGDTRLEHDRLLVGEKGSNRRYGYVDYTLVTPKDGEEYIRIDGVNIRAGFADDIAEDMVLEVMRRNDGIKVEWDADTEYMKGVRDRLVKGNKINPGELQRFDSRTFGDNREIAKHLTEHFRGNLTNAEANTMAAMLSMQERDGAKWHLNKDGSMSLVDRNGDILTEIRQDTEGVLRDKNGNLKALGGFTLKDTLKKAKSVIYVSEKGNFSTFAHEVFHFDVAFDKKGSKNLAETLSKAAKDEGFREYLKAKEAFFRNSLGLDTDKIMSELGSMGTDQAKWSDNQQEIAASLFELYLTEGKTFSDRLKTIFDKIADFFLRIYRSLSRSKGVKMNDDIVKAFDSMLDSNETLRASYEGQTRNETSSTLFQRPSEDDIAKAESEYKAVENQYKGTPQWMKAPNGKPTKLTERQWVQVRTPAFKAWFGDWENDPANASKVVDENGEPLVVYHGTTENFDIFDYTKGEIRSDRNTKSYMFTTSKELAAKFSEAPGETGFPNNVFEVFINLRDPSEYNFDGASQSGFYLDKFAIYDLYNDQTKKTSIDEEENTFSTREEAEKYIQENDIEDAFINNDYVKIADDQNIVGSVNQLVEDEHYNNEHGFSSSDGLTIKNVRDTNNFFVNDFEDEDEKFLAESILSDFYIVFSPNQIKSATDNVGTFSTDNPSILFQRRIKKDLVSTEEIADYMEDWLNKIGYKTERDYSGLSDSQYITILNYKDMTGKESIINENEEYKIRISTHDLPPSYDGLHGYHDVDVMSENKFRGGNDGRATWYDIVLRDLESEVTPDAKAKFDAENKAPTDIEYPKWLSDPKSIQIKMDEAKSIDLKLDLSHLLRGGDWSHYKKPTVTQRKKYFAKSVEQAKDVVNAVDKPPYKKYKEDPNFRELVDFWLTEGGYEKTLRQYNEVKGYNSHSNLLFQLIGELGATALDRAEEATTRLDNLATAREMEKAGKDARAIRLATGWERGADGKWRYEIDDSGYVFDIDGTKQFEKEHPEIKAAKDKEWAFIMGEDVKLTDAEEAILHHENDIKKNRRQKLEHGVFKLSEILDAPELYSAYPQLKAIDVVFEDKDIQERGSYSHYTISINKRIDMKYDLPRILIHEIQHIIQHLEGFSRGGNPKNMRVVPEPTELTRALASYSGITKEELENFSAEKVMEMYKEVFTPEELSQVNKNIDGLGTVEEIIERDVRSHGADWMFNEIQQAKKVVDSAGLVDITKETVNKWLLLSKKVFDKAPKELQIKMRSMNEAIIRKDFDRLEELENGLSEEERKIWDDYYEKHSNALKAKEEGVYESPYSVYQSLAGEVEARNAQARMNMTPEERRNTLLSKTEDVAREDQIVLMDGLEAQMALEQGRFNDSHSNLLFQSAYHGSGASFDKFDTDFIGTGEGAQAFGWGHYVTQSNGIARSYAEQMRSNIVYRGDNFNALWNKEHTPEIRAAYKVVDLMERGYTFQEAKDNYIKDANKTIEELRKSMEGDTGEIDWDEQIKAYEEVIEAIDKLDESDFSQRKRNLYTVEIPDDTGKNYLYWDKPVGKRVLKRVAKGLDNLDIKADDWGWFPEYIKGLPTEDKLLYRITKQADYLPTMGGANLYGAISNLLGSDKSASEFLNSIGFVGINYPANSLSGGSKSGKRNFVIFNDNDLTITDHTLFQNNPNYDPDEAFYEDARMSETAEDFVAYARTMLDEDKTEAEWRRIWNKANGIQTGEGAISFDFTGKSDAEKDKAFRAIAETDDGIRAIVNNLRAVFSDYAMLSSPTNTQGGLEQDEIARLNDLMTRTDSFERQASPFFFNIVQGDNELSGTSIKKIRTTIIENIEAYRTLYEETTGSTEISSDPNAEPDIAEPRQAASPVMSIAEKARLEKEIHTKEVLEGLRKDDKYRDAIKTLDDRIAKLDEQIKNLSDEYAELNAADAKKEREIQDLKAENKEKLKEQEERLGEKRKEQLSKLREEYKEKIQKLADERKAADKERRAAKKLHEYKVKLLNFLQREPSDNVNYEQRKMAETIVDVFRGMSRNEANIRYNGKKYTLNEFKDAVEGGQIDVADITAYQLKRYLDNSIAEYTVDDLEYIARQKHDLEVMGRQIWAAKEEQRRYSYKVYRDALRDALSRSSKYTGNSDRPLPQTKEAEQDTFKDKFTWLKTRFLTMARVAQMLDGGEKGLTYEILVRKKRAVQSEYFRAIDARLEPVLKLMEELGVKADDFYEDFNLKLSWKNVWTTFTVSDLIYGVRAALEDRNLQAFTYGNLFTEAEKEYFSNDSMKQMGQIRYAEFAEKAKKILSDPKYANILKIADAIWNDWNNEQTRERLNKTAIDEYNIPIDPVKNYMPISRKDFDGTDITAKMANDLYNMNAGKGATSVDRGMIKNRIDIAPKHQKAVDTNYFKLWQDSVLAQERFITHNAYIRDLNGIFKFNAGALRDDIRSTIGKAVLDDIDEYINQVANPEIFTDKQRVNRVITWMRGNLYPAYLAFKASPVVLQLITSPAPFLAKVNPVELAENLVKMTLHPKEMWDEVTSLSSQMKHRIMNPFVDDMDKAVKNYGDPEVIKVWRKILEVGTKPLTMVDKWAVIAGWKAVYDKKRAELEAQGMNPQQASDKAVSYTDEFVLETQPTGDITELAPMFKTKNAAVNALTQFQVSLNVIWNNITYDAWHSDKRTAIGMLLGYALAGAILYAVQEGYGGDDEKDKEKRFLKFLYSMTTQYTASIPLVGSDSDALVKRALTGEKGYPASRMMYPAAQSVLEGIGQGKWEKVLYGLGLFSGFPVSGKKEIEHVFRNNKTGEWRFYPQALTGRREN